MSNTSSMNISIDLIRASFVLSVMEPYIYVALYIFGFIGSLLNIFVFLHKRLRMKSCSIYFLVNSIVDFSYVNFFILMQVIYFFNHQIMLTITSTNAWCKWGSYLSFLLPCLGSSYIILASIDRCCASSLKETFRKFNRLTISYILSLFVAVIWSVFSLHIPISYNRFQQTPTSPIKCTPPAHVIAVFIFINGYFFALFNGLISPILLILFGLIIFRNVQLFHRRILPQLLPAAPNSTLTQTNRHLIRMLFFQVSLTIFLYIPFIVLYLYGIHHSRPIDDLPLLFYQIFIYIARWFWALNYCKTFYVNMFFSRTFRHILRRRFLQLSISNHQPNVPDSSSSESTDSST